jgi:RES domain
LHDFDEVTLTTRSLSITRHEELVANQKRKTLRGWSRILFKRLLSITWIRAIVSALDLVGGLAIRTKVGAWLVGALIPGARPVLCSECFTDHGLSLDAARVGIDHAHPCPSCGSRTGKKLTPFLLESLAHRFFVRGSLLRLPYGGAPSLQFNEMQYRQGSYVGPKWLAKDVAQINEAAKIGIFHYGPRFWMLGEVEPLRELQDPSRRQKVVERIISEYPSVTWDPTAHFYRLRLNPADPTNDSEYDGPPHGLASRGRFDSSDCPIMYCAMDVEGSTHECRATVDDAIFLATLKPRRVLKLLDLTELLEEPDVTEFESLDMAVHMLFCAGNHSYEITRDIGRTAQNAGFDGIIYPSYFSQVRSGRMPFETSFGISVRRLPGAAQYAKSGVYPNLALFGRPLEQGIVEVLCINRVFFGRINYDLHFGPIPDDDTLLQEKAIRLDG